MIERIYERSEVKFTYEGLKSGWCETTSGVRQGCPLSPLFFNLYIKEVCRKIEGSEYGVMYMVMNEKEEVEYKSCACFLYADDIVLSSNNEEELQLLIDEVWGREWRMLEGWLVWWSMQLKDKGAGL